MKRVLLFGMLMLALATAAAAEQDLLGATSDTKLGPRDVIDIKVFQDPTLNSRVAVNEDGQITLPLIGKIAVSGLTPVEVEARLKSQLESKVLTTADVSVQVVQYGNKPISVLGAVTRPGSIGMSGNVTLIQAITAAGGLANGYGKTLYVLRTGANGLTEQIAIDIDDLLVNGNADLNIPLAPNDVVNVPMDTPTTIYVLGEVMRPGTVQFRRSQNPTLLQALAGAGGLTDRASKTVMIKRIVGGKPVSLNVNYRKITDGNAPDVPLLDNDTIVVRESLF
jgi:polysaccharide export outer membrane protein